MEQQKRGMLRTFLQTASDLTKVAPKVTEELSQVLEDAKDASSFSNILGILEEKIKRITHAVKDDIEQKMTSIQNKIQRQFLYQWIVIFLGIGIAIALALFR